MPAAFPKLRPLDIRRVTQNGEGYFLLRDPVGLTQQMALVPEAMGLLLALCDGTRDVQAIATGFSLRTNVTITGAQVSQIIEQLGQALFLDDERSRGAHDAALRAYHEAPFRPPSLAGKVYPGDPAALAAALKSYCAQATASVNGAAASAPVVGIISPHIDYQRGWPVYASLWRQAAKDIAEAELVIVFGTDHAGGPGRITLTRQRYATPWGPLPTDQKTVDALAAALGEEAAFGEELHHRNEHSVELALVWLHYFLQPKSVPVVPVLCGSFHEFVMGQADPATDQAFTRAMRVLRDAASGRRTLVIAAADLAHVGPNFGDPSPWRATERDSLKAADQSLLQAISAGDPHRFFDELRRAGDRNRVCGMPPIYLTLRMLEGAQGVTTGYDQCPADADGGSLVSIAGALLHAR